MKLISSRIKLIMMQDKFSIRTGCRCPKLHGEKYREEGSYQVSVEEEQNDFPLPVAIMALIYLRKGRAEELGRGMRGRGEGGRRAGRMRRTMTGEEEEKTKKRRE